jgi:hypothetical protein
MNGLSTVQIDKRAFKGKGVNEWLSRLHRDYAKLVSEMELLSTQSRDVAGNAWYVYLHHRKSTDQYFLMWRSFGVKHVHLRWENLQSMLQRMTAVERFWYEQINEAILLLNAKEKAARTALKLAKGLLEGEADAD